MNDGIGLEERYRKMVVRLAKPGHMIVASLTPETAHLWHMATGIAGEAGELLAGLMPYFDGTGPLDKENVIEECGDLEFYARGIREPLQLHRAPTADPDPDSKLENHTANVVIATTDILDIIKKHVVYTKSLDIKTLELQFQMFEEAMAGVRTIVGFTREQCLRFNMEKLMNKRYKSGSYSDQQAQARADKEPPLKGAFDEGMAILNGEPLPNMSEGNYSPSATQIAHTYVPVPDISRTPLPDDPPIGDEGQLAPPPMIDPPGRPDTPGPEDIPQPIPREENPMPRSMTPASEAMKSNKRGDTIL